MIHNNHAALHVVLLLPTLVSDYPHDVGSQQASSVFALI